MHRYDLSELPFGRFVDGGDKYGLADEDMRELVFAQHPGHGHPHGCSQRLDTYAQATVTRSLAPGGRHGSVIDGEVDAGLLAQLIHGPVQRQVGDFEIANLIERLTQLFRYRLFGW